MYVELKGSGAVTPVSAMLAGWRIRVKPQGLPGAFFVLPANATPTSGGLFVLADSPPAGETQVPLFSVQSKNVAAGDDETGGGVLDGRDLDDYLRADRPDHGQALPARHQRPEHLQVRPDRGRHTGLRAQHRRLADDDRRRRRVRQRVFRGPPDAAETGYQPTDAIQRSNIYQFDDDNSTDFCARDATRLQTNYVCFGDT